MILTDTMNNVNQAKSDPEKNEAGKTQIFFALDSDLNHSQNSMGS